MSPTRRTTPRPIPRVLLCYLESNPSILRGIARFVRDFGPWSLRRMPVFHDEHMPSWLQKWEGDGIIGRVTNKQSAALMSSTKLPVIDILGGSANSGIPLVHSDDAAVGRLAAEHLIELGFHHFGFYGSSQPRWSRERAAGYADAVTRAGGELHTYNGRIEFSGATAWEKAESSAARWLMKLPKPAAVMGANDKLAERVINAARSVNIQVPDEVAVIGVNDDTLTFEITDPPLTTVIRDFETQGYLAAEVLHQLMDGKPPPPSPLLVRPLSVQVRQSTDVLAIDDPDITRAIRFIRQHACDGIGIADVLREVPLSRSVLQRRFRRILGQTVNEAIIAQRVKRAQQLLTETDRPLQEIAERAGFTHQQYMGAVFRKRLGLTPKRYRDQKTRPK